MGKCEQNVATAAGTVGYYDDLWKKLGSRLDYTERNRAHFVSNSIRDFVGCNGLRILDFGCGRGWMAPFLSPFGSVIGIDFSAKGIQFARENYGSHAQFILADIHSVNLGLPREMLFDVVVCSEVIEHVPDHLALLRQIAVLLRPGGWCVLTTPNGNVWERYRERFKSQLQPIENWLSTNQLVARVQEAGFLVLRHEGSPMFGFRVGRMGGLQRRRIERLFTMFHLERLYGRLILATALYQMIVCRKRL